MGTYFPGDPTNPLTGRVIGAAITIHRHLGPGLLESTYETCLAAELRHIGLAVQRQVPVPLVYRDLHLPRGYVIDLLVEDQIVVEVKAATALHPVFTSQVRSYLKFAGLRVGLLFNFNVDALVAGGMKRIVAR